VLSVYVDETGQHAKGLVIVSGWFGDKDAWDRCALAWPAAFGRSQKRTLHLSKWKFKSKSEKDLLERLGPVPASCGLQPVSGSVNVADYADLVEGSVADVHAHGYTMAMVPLILAIRGAIPPDETFEIVFEEQTALGLYREKALQMISRIMDRNQDKRKKQLVGWHTLTKNQSRMFEPADYLCHHLAHKSSNPFSRRAVWTNPIVGNGHVHIQHLTKEWCRELFSISPSLRIDPEELDRMKRAIRAGEYDPWQDLYAEQDAKSEPPEEGSV
jgi:hypothetical protein